MMVQFAKGLNVSLIGKNPDPLTYLSKNRWGWQSRI